MFLQFWHQQEYQKILDALKLKSADLEKFQAIGCNGTAVKKGVIRIRLLETVLNGPLQWLVCQLHTNELLLSQLILYVDEATAGPHAFSGSIGKSLATCHSLLVRKHYRVDGELSMIDVQELSSDQKYFYEICNTVINGMVCPQDLSLRNPGATNHSRWLTTGNRILWLCIGTEQLSNKLTTLTNFVIQVYAPMWFSTNCKPSCENGTGIFFGQAGYFDHAENLLSMMTDKGPSICELGLRRI